MVISPSKRRMLVYLLVCVFLALGLVACSDEAEGTPTANPAEIFTQIAQQVSVGLTQTAAAMPPPSVTPMVPTAPLEPQQGPTVAGVATIAGQEGGPAVATLPPDLVQVTPSAQPTEESQTVEGGGEETQKCKYRALLGYDSPKDETWIQEKKGFKRIWVLTNVGDCEWPLGTFLRHVGGELFKADATIVITDQAVPVGERVRVETSMEAPDLPAGTGSALLQSNWMLGTPDGRLFGSGTDGKGFFWIKINVCEEKVCKEHM